MRLRILCRVLPTFLVCCALDCPATVRPPRHMPHAGGETIPLVGSLGITLGVPTVWCAEEPRDPLMRRRATFCQYSPLRAEAA